MLKVTKTEIVNALVDNYKLTYAEARSILDFILNIAVETLKRDGKLCLAPLGVFNIIVKKKKKAYDIYRNRFLEMNDYRKIKFKPSSSLKKHLRTSCVIRDITGN